jgi:predicted O-methyltransferase YrrM
LRQRPGAVRYAIPWALSRRQGRSAINDGMPWVPFRAQRWLSRLLSREMRVFEWGSGGSTLFLARRVREVVSIEHDAAWYELVAQRLQRSGVQNCKYQLVPPRQAPPGGTAFGSEQRDCKHLCFEAYVRAIDGYPDGHFDFVMIDGRARLACLRAAWRKVRVGGHIFLDNSNYERYQASLAGPPEFERRDIAGVSPYGGEVWTQSTVWHRLS